MVERVQNLIAVKCSKSDCLPYLRDLFKLKRTAATHLMSIMIAEERRMKKPYAMPVRFIPYRSCTDQMAKDWANEVADVLEFKGMNVTGQYKAKS